MIVAYKNIQDLSSGFSTESTLFKGRKLANDFKYLEEELQFFIQLSGLAIQNGTEFRRSKMIKIMQELIDFRDQVLPPIHPLIMGNDMMPGYSIIDLTDNFHRCLHQFKKIKQRLFPFIYEMQEISLW